MYRLIIVRAGQETEFVTGAWEQIQNALNHVEEGPFLALQVIFVPG